MRSLFRTFLFGWFLLIALIPGLALAQSTPNQSNVGPSRPLDLNPASNAGLFNGVTMECWKNGTCNICDGLIVFINVANGILGLLAIVAVVFFVYGAGHLALSSGNENYVHKGKEAIKAAIIGTIIVLGAWQIMAIVVMIIANQNGELINNPSRNPIVNWYTVAGECAKSNSQK